MKNCRFDFIIAQLTQPMILVMELLKKTQKSETLKNVGYSKIKDVTMRIML